MEVSINGGTPIWMENHGKSPLSMDDDWGYPYFRKPPYGKMTWKIEVTSERL